MQWAERWFLDWTSAYSIVFTYNFNRTITISHKNFNSLIIDFFFLLLLKLKLGGEMTLWFLDSKES